MVATESREHNCEGWHGRLDVVVVSIDETMSILKMNYLVYG